MAAFKAEGKKEIKKFARFLSMSEKDAQKVMAWTLTEQAKAQTKNSMKVLGRELVVRNPRFFKSSFGTVFAKSNKSVNSNFALSGSKERDRFSGWVEQQTGQAAESHRVATSAARKGSIQEMMFGKARLKTATNPLTIRDIKIARSGRGLQKQRTIALLRAAKKRKRSILIPRRDARKVGVHKRIEPGLYMFQGNKLLRLQTFGKSYKPKRVDWSGKALKMTARQADFLDVFNKKYAWLMKKRGAR